MKTDGEIYNESIITKLRKIMAITDLEITGFSDFIGRQPSHIYGILNGSRILSTELAKRIGEKLGFDGAKILNLNDEIPIKIAKSENLIKFKKENKENPMFFASNKAIRSINTFVTEQLIQSGYFTEKRYLSDTLLYIKTIFGMEYSSDQLSKALRYAVSKGNLKSIKAPIKLKNGDFGSRVVDIYFC